MDEDINCPRCRRERWTDESSLPVNLDQCESTGNSTCVLTANQNSLVAALRSVTAIAVALSPKGLAGDAALRTALAVVEHVRPSSRHCPTCGRPEVVGRGVVGVHYARNEDQRPCDASYGVVLGGMLIKVTK